MSSVKLLSSPPRGPIKDQRHDLLMRRAGSGTFALFALPLLAGCGGAFNAKPGALRIDLQTPAVRTGQQLRLSAIQTGSGDPVSVRWRVTASDNAPALGAGSISADGVYTPPSMLSRDVVTVQITADGDESALGAPATATLSIVPGFAEPLQPENATLAPGSSIQVRAQLAEVGSGVVRWSLESTSGITGDATLLGSLSGRHCESSRRQFTTCTVTYTAPSPASGALVWLVASTRSASSLPGVAVRARLALGEVTSDPALHQVEQPTPIALGGSGGSDNDFDTYKDHTGARYLADCCGGTLGALVEDQSGTPYILSNNHVLAASDQGRPGDTIEQPGLIDDGCVPLSQAGSHMQPVGALRYTVPLDLRRTNVDAALASVNPGTVDPGGSILELGPEPAAASADNTLHSAPPVAGIGEVLDAARLDRLRVAKSGRTTGLTCSTIDAVDLRVTVDYYKDCAETQPYVTKTFTGQIAIGGDAFADSGDSGSLVVDAANARAVGLLYATGISGDAATAGGPSPGVGLTLANPIGDVLNELSAEAGTPLTLRGTTTPHPVACLKYDTPPARPALDSLPADERARVASAVEAAESLRSARVLAVGPGVSADEHGRGAVLVYIDPTQPWTPVPDTIGGVRTVIVPASPEAIAHGPSAWPSAGVPAGIQLGASLLAAARTTADRLGPRMMQTPAVFGVGVAQSLDNPDEAALLVLIDSDASQLETIRALDQMAGEDAQNGPQTGSQTGVLPAMLGGMRVRYLTMHRMRVTQSKFVARGAPSSCAVRSSGHSELTPAGQSSSHLASPGPGLQMH